MPVFRQRSGHSNNCDVKLVSTNAQCDGCRMWGRICLPFRSTWCHSQFYERIQALVFCCFDVDFHNCICLLFFYFGLAVLLTLWFFFIDASVLLCRCLLFLQFKIILVTYNDVRQTEAYYWVFFRLKTASRDPVFYGLSSIRNGQIRKKVHWHMER